MEIRGGLWLPDLIPLLLSSYSLDFHPIILFSLLFQGQYRDKGCNMLLFW